MSDAHRRPKLPDQTRHSLIEAAITLVLTKGFSALTLAAVTDLSGVTKGALIHHFGSKQGLIDSLCQEILGRIDSELDAALQASPPGYGHFTRAYIHCTFCPAKSGSPWSSLSIASVGDAELARIWRDWLAGRLAQHAATDADAALLVPRLAADGWWAAHHFQRDFHDTPETAALMNRLIALTHSPQPHSPQPHSPQPQSAQPQSAQTESSP